MKRFSFLIFVFIVLFEIINGQTVCDEIAAKEECMTRGCDCWWLSGNVNTKEWLTECISNLCSYSDICSEYGCTFEECVEGNCDLEIDYTSICEKYCKEPECGLIVDLYPDPIVVYTTESQASVVATDVILPDFADIYTSMTIEFDLVFSECTGKYKKHGAMFIGSGTDLAKVFQTTSNSVIDWTDNTGEATSGEGFRFSGINNLFGLSNTISRNNGVNYDYSKYGWNPNGRWKLFVNKLKESNFYFNNNFVYGGFTIVYPDTAAKLGFWASNKCRVTASNIQVSYDSL